MDAFVICNPTSGGGRGAARAATATATLREHGWNLEVRHTRSPGHARDLAAQAAREGAPLVIAAGGDGTTFEVVNGLFPARGPIPKLGILPVGTGNSFGRDFDLLTTDDALQALLAGRSRPCDVVRATHDEGALHYVNLLSIGFSAEAGDLTNRRFKRLGIAGYGLAVVGSLVRLRHPAFRYALDDAPPHADPVVLLSFSNSRYTGGTMCMAPDAHPADGLLDVIEVGPMSRRRLLSAFPKIYAGTHTALAEVSTARAKRVALDLPGPIACMIDGEILTLRLRSLEVLPAALEIAA